ncbi:MAG: methylmalonyl Co-A mutase-associated GTPase MeaB, partial [Gammaproteobacteria bacterium]|nr:methylmalonyl Co-A mutase-associated GTPase MeaB [Gammaproteobacteria bacterium]
DGDLENAASRSAADYRGALGFLHPRRQNWVVPVATCSALNKIGIDNIWTVINDFHTKMTDNGTIKESRAQQAKAWLWNEISATLLESMHRNDGIRSKVAELEEQVTRGTTSPWVAAQKIISTFQQQDDKNS